MKVALDATPLTVPKSGIGEYTSQLAYHLAARFPEDEFLLLSNFSFAQVSGPRNLRSLCCPTNWITGRWWLVGLPLALEREKVDVFHGTDYAVPFLPLRPCLLTIHDLSSVRWSYLHERRTRRTARRLPWMARVATHVVTPSMAVRQEVQEEFNLPDDKVSVLPHAAAPRFRQSAAGESGVAEKYGLRPPYVLFVGTLEPRKNLAALVRAFSRLPSALFHETQLVLCGGVGWKNNALWKEIEGLGMNGKVCITGYVADDELTSIYRGATVFVYPSLYEGFGLPPLEAMSCGIPVIASNDRALMEVLGDAAVHVDPLDAEALGRALEEMLGNPSNRERYARRGMAHVERFSWVKTAEGTHALYERIVAEHVAPRWGPLCRALLNCVPTAERS